MLGSFIGIYLFIGILVTKAARWYAKKHGYTAQCDSMEVMLVVLLWPIVVVELVGILFFESVTEWINK